MRWDSAAEDKPITHLQLDALNHLLHVVGRQQKMAEAFEALRVAALLHPPTQAGVDPSDDSAAVKAVDGYLAWDKAR